MDPSLSTGRPRVWTPGRRVPQVGNREVDLECALGRELHHLERLAGQLQCNAHHRAETLQGAETCFWV